MTSSNPSNSGSTPSRERSSSGESMSGRMLAGRSTASTLSIPTLVSFPTASFLACRPASSPPSMTVTRSKRSRSPPAYRKPTFPDADEVEHSGADAREHSPKALDENGMTALDSVQVVHRERLLESVRKKPVRLAFGCSSSVGDELSKFVMNRENDTGVIMPRYSHSSSSKPRDVRYGCRKSTSLRLKASGVPLGFGDWSRRGRP